MTRTLLKSLCRLAIAIGMLGFAPAQAADNFLPPTEAFKYEAHISDGRLIVKFMVHDGYYLYRARLAFESATPGVTLGPPEFPAGEDHEDDYFGRQVIYRGTVSVPMAVNYAAVPVPLDLKLKLQGCADAGLCYPPTTWTTTVAAPTEPERSSAAAPAGTASAAGAATVVVQVVGG